MLGVPRPLGRRTTGCYIDATYATLALLDGESPAVVASNLGISLATLGKHYAAAIRRGMQPRMRPAIIDAQG